MGVPGQSSASLARFVAREALAYAAKGALLPLSGLGPGHARRTSHPEGITLVMVHGYGSGRGAFTLLARGLARKLEHPKLEHLAAFGYFTAGKRFEDLTRKLAAFTCEIAPRGKLVFLGHSIGGLLCRAALQGDEVLRARTLGLCTLSTPHHGLAGAPFLRALPVVRELAPGAKLMRRLEEGDASLDALPCLSIISTRDHFVREPRSAAFGQAELHQVDHVGHVGVLFDDRVCRRIVTFLHQVAPTGDKEQPS